MGLISITKATEEDYKSIAAIGNVAVEEAHRGSCLAADLQEYLEKNYNDDALKAELNDTHNIYHIVNYNGMPVGFSKIVLNAKHPNIEAENVTKLDRIYLLKEFFGLQLGLELLNFNIRLAKSHNQSGMWLFTWVGNERAIAFYDKTGFKIIGSHQFYVTKTYYNLNHHMLLTLTDAKTES